jgi:hypothetical protein
MTDDPQRRGPHQPMHDPRLQGWPQPQHPQQQQGWPQPPHGQPWPPPGYQQQASAPGWGPPAAPPLPPDGIPTDEKTTALVAYAGAFVMPIVLPILLMATATNKPFQRAAALQATIFQVIVLALSFIAPLFGFAFMFSQGSPGMAIALIYLPLVVVMVLGVVFAVFGMLAAHRGQILYAPLIGRRMARSFNAEWPPSPR